jgi:hypothetical protein
MKRQSELDDKLRIQEYKHKLKTGESLRHFFKDKGRVRRKIEEKDIV